MNQRYLLQLFVFVGSFVSATALDAATYYVASSGDDVNDGFSPAKAWKTMEKVNGYPFEPGDTILFNRGDTWNYGLAPSVSGEEGKPITFSSYGAGSKPLIYATAAISKADASVWFNEKEYLVLDGFEITGDRRYPIRFTASDFVTVQNSYIHHLQVPAHFTHCMTGSGDHIRILRNEIAYCGLEGFYGNTTNIEIGYNYIHHTDLVSELQEPACQGKGDVVQLNCWSTGYNVHHNTLDHSNSCGGKGTFISSHCTLDCLDNEPRCTDDIQTQYSNGIFTDNVIFSGPNDTFGFSNAGYGDTVSNNSFVYKKDDFSPEVPPAQHGIQSEKGIVVINNIVDGYQYAFSLGKDNSVFTYYNNILRDISVRTFKGSTDTRKATVEFRNNVLFEEFRPRKCNSNQVFHVSDNVSTVGFYTGSDDNPGTIHYEGANMVMTPELLLFTDLQKGDYSPLPDSPLIDSGRFVEIQYKGSVPNIGLLTK